MKNIFKSLIALLAAGTLFTACQQEATLLGTTIEVSPSDAINFVAQNATPVSVTVSCDGDWISTSSDWIDVEPAFGTGQTSVKIVAKDNVDANGKVGLPREGSVSFAGTGCKAEIPVTQDGDEDLLVETLPYTINFKEDMTKWKFSIISNPDELSYVWAQDAQYGMKASAYVGSNHPSEAWLISPAFDLTAEETAILSFNHTYNYAADTYLDVQVTKDGGETWTKIQHDLIHWGDQNWTFEESGDIDLSSYCGEKIKIAFVYTSAAEAAATWEISDFSFLNTALPSIAVKNNAVEITATTLEATFDIVAKNLEAGKNWTLTADEDYSWVTAIEPSTGTESAAVKVTVTENTDTENDRNASFTLKSEGLTDVTMTLTQAKGINVDDTPVSIAELKKQIVTKQDKNDATKIDNYAVKVENAVVTYKNGNNVFIEDNTGAVLLFLKDNTFKVGDVINGLISGTGYIYNHAGKDGCGFAELTSMDLSKAEVTSGDVPAPAVLTLAALLADFNRYLNAYVKIEGVDVVEGVKNPDTRTGKIAQGDKEILLYTQNKNATLEILAGAKGDVICFPTCYGETLEVGIFEQGHFIPDASAKTFSVSPEEITVEADATSAKITVSGNAAWTATASTGAAVEPASGEGAGEITVTFAANEGAEPVAYTVTVATEDDVETKSFEVVINQKAAVVPAKTLPYEESFASSFGEFKLNDVQLPEGSTYVWKLDATNHYAKASSYFSGKNHASESWLVSPEIEMPASGYAGLSFDFAMNYGTASDYPNAFYGYVICGEEKTKIEFQNIPSSGSWTWINEVVDLSAYAGKTIKFAFVYVSTDSAACTVELKNVKFTNVRPKVDNVITATASLSIEKGATAQIEASNTGNLAMTYTSSDETVATVDANGLVTAVAAGTATITTATAATAEYNAASATCAVTVIDPDGPQTLIIDGAPLTGTATTALTEYVYDGVTVAMSDGAKYQASSGENKFAAKAILIGKSGKYIFNKTAIPGKITKFEIYANKGASTNVSVGVCFSDKPISAYDSTNAWTKTLSTLDSVYDCSSKLSGNDSYFWFQVTNANNAQVQFRITYVKGGDEGESGEGQIGIDDWTEENPGTGSNEGYGNGGSLNDWIVD